MNFPSAIQFYASNDGNWLVWQKRRWKGQKLVDKTLSLEIADPKNLNQVIVIYGLVAV